MRKIWKCVIIILTVSLGIVFLSYSCDAMINGIWYTTEDISDYGQIKGNRDDDTVREFFMSYFPEKIEPWFENVVFSYKANNQCSYRSEMHLEFTISDPVQFQSYVTELTAGLEAQEFPYDAKYDDYIVHNHLYVEPSTVDGPGDQTYFLRCGARMGRILVCQEEQRIICEGIIASTCCGGFDYEFDFYNRYGIDPQEYSDQFCNDDEYQW